MRRLSPLVLAGLCLAACQPEPRADEAEAARPAPTLVGLWQTEAPVRSMGENLRTEGEGQTEYGPDGRFRYAGRLTIQGEKLPPDGLSFRVAGEGAWKLENRTLSEDFTSVRVEPELQNKTLARLAEQIGHEMVEQPPTLSLIDLNGNRLALRDRDTGQEAHYIRLR